MPDADLSDVSSTSYLAEMPSPISIYREENSSVINKLHPSKVVGSGSIPSFVLKCLGSPLFPTSSPSSKLTFIFHTTLLSFATATPFH